MRTRKIGKLNCVAVLGETGDTVLSGGMTVRIQRDPGDAAASMAVRVAGDDDRTLGYLRRSLTLWLAPLMDRGWLVVGATVTGAPEGRSLPLELDLRLTERGHQILAPVEEDPTPAEELHAEVISHWPAGNKRQRDAMEAIRERVRRGEAGPVLPETRMLLEVDPVRRRTSTKRKKGENAAAAVETVRRILEGARVEEALSSGNLALFPVRLPAEEAPDVAPFDAAHAAGHVTVTETGRGGNVNELIVANTGPSAVLLPQGLVLVGGKQDRMVAVAVLIPAGRKRRVPVNCVEAGRWSWESARMAPRRVATPSIRKSVSSVPAQHVADMQHEVWDQVACLSHRLESFSATRSMDEIYEGIKLADTGALLLQMPEDACGLVATASGRLLGCDLFGSAGLMAPMRQRLVESWAVEARMQGVGDDGSPESEEMAALLLDAVEGVRLANEKCDNGVTRLVVESPRHSGAILLRGQHLLHMSLFPAG